MSEALKSKRKFSSTKKREKEMEFKQGYVYLIDFGEYRYHVKGGTRPGVVISNNHENRYASQILVAPITTIKPKHLKKQYRNDVIFEPSDLNGLDATSVVHAGNIRSIDKADFLHQIGKLEEENQKKVVNGFLYTVGLSGL